MIARSPQQRLKLKAFECLCCQRRLTETNTFCPDCDTPADLSQTVATRGEDKNFISMLGASNSGKTVYIGMLLDMLHQGTQDFHGLPGSSYSVHLQQHVINSLTRRQFPPKTPSDADSWNWLHCEINTGTAKDQRINDLICPDFAGEAIAAEILNPGFYPMIQTIVSKSSGILLLCDAIAAQTNSVEEDLFALKVATYIARNHGLNPKTRRQHTTHQTPRVAIVFTKTDGCSAAADHLNQFAESHLPRLTDYCKHTFDEHQFFAASVAGNVIAVSDSTGIRSKIPVHITPKGILEPLRWLINR